MLSDIREVLAGLPEVLPQDRAAHYFQSPTYYPVYTQIAAWLEPHSLLEFGTRLGYSLIALAHGAPDVRRAWWVDNECGVKDSNAKAWRNLTAYYEGVRGTAPPEAAAFTSDWELAPLLAGSQVDLIHIDGEHAYHAVVRELELAYQLAPRCILVDDWCGAPIQEAVKAWARSRNIGFRVVDTCDHGLAVIDLTAGRKVLTPLLASSWRILERVEW